MNEIAFRMTQEAMGEAPPEPERKKNPAAVALHFAHYDFVRPHISLKTTAAMAAGVTDYFRRLEDLLAWEVPYNHTVN